ncbi:waprin-like protein [Cydia strobilella]|uniref:waprin-like protein n=1 Tax=Cydia strobilella TaxID=1100964 RepID=UPI0030055F77
MGSLTTALSVFAVLLAIGYSEASGSCPVPSKVYSCSPKCKENYECSNGKLCCRNGCNEKSCAEPVGGSQGAGGNKYGAGSNSGIYCNNQKCSPQEVCKMDPSTKRMRCVRS